ncbi:hypothetical protein IHE45_17G093200 [Dioscorea alata]|uniref:Uncharacterized protein n=1 Tax=Dioscorea alata TaxID=55571 RepID=A0ACB7UDW1_DIOAL|nr:hypothetical protein IHE45_17G093200 [Dioscorea alata]
MKRTRAENPLSKPQKKSRDSTKAPAKVKKESPEEKRTSPEAPLESPPPALPPAEEEQSLWDFSGECGWWWGVEDEVLLGWFPFGEEDFLCSENRVGGAFWEDYHDIWQLQHIHEIPSSANNA